MSHSLVLLGVPGLVNHNTGLPAIDAGAKFIGAFQGGVTTNSIDFAANLSSQSSAVQIYYSKNPDLSNYQVTTATPSDGTGWAKISLSGLSADTTYYWTVANDGKRTATIGKFKTLASSYSYVKVLAASCATTSSNSTIFTVMQSENAELFQHTGDLHYRDISANSIPTYRLGYEDVLNQSNQRNLYHSLPLDYMWDDHDYGPNNSDAFSVGRPAARTAYRSYMASYPLPAANAGAIYHSYAVGNILFVVTDNRSERSVYTDTDDASKSVLGTEQKQWFKDTLLAAKGVYRGVIWINSFPWLGDTPLDDEWSWFKTERTELSNYCKTNAIPLLAIVCGDAHMIACDNGTGNEIYGVASYQFAAMDQTSSLKGGNFSHPTFQGGSQYGTLEFYNSTPYLKLVGTGKNGSTGSPVLVSKHTTFATKWMAFNDCYGQSGSGYSRVNNVAYVASSPVTTALVDYKTGSTLTTTITLNTTGTGAALYTGTGSTVTPTLAHLTDLHDRFKNAMNPIFVPYEVSAGNSYVITLGSLDSTKYYLIEFSSDRANSPYNNQRGVKVTIGGYSYIENLSSTGTVTTTNTVTYASGYNTVNGHIGRFVVKPTSSTITITSDYDTVTYPSGLKGYPVKFFCVSELL